MDFILDNIEKIIFFFLFFILPQFFKKKKKQITDDHITESGGKDKDLDILFASENQDQKNSAPSLADMLEQIKANAGKKTSSPKSLPARTTSSVVKTPKVQSSANSAVRHTNRDAVYHTQMSGSIQDHDRNIKMSQSSAYDDKFEAEAKNRDTAHGFHRPGEHPLEHKSYSDEIYGAKVKTAHPLIEGGNLQDAFVLSEVLQKPVSLRKKL